MNELIIQKYLYQNIILHGGHGFKLSNRNLIGIPDLIVQHQRLGTWIIEVKYLRYEWSENHITIIHTTDMQRNFMKNWIRAGGNTGFMVVMPTGEMGSYAVRLCIDPDATHVTNSNGWTDFKRSGKEWPMFRMLKHWVNTKETGVSEW